MGTRVSPGPRAADGGAGRCMPGSGGGGEQAWWTCDGVTEVQNGNTGKYGAMDHIDSSSLTIHHRIRVVRFSSPGWICVYILFTLWHLLIFDGLELFSVA